MSNDDVLRYPRGKFAPQETYSESELKELINRIDSFPQRFEAVAKSLSQKQLDTCYRDGGWTARQVIHHVADSHMNAYIRLKWSLTENTPTIKAYDEKLWAQTPEVHLDPWLSLNLLKALHVKWTALLRSIEPSDLQRQFVHPETRKHVGVDRLIATYAWHGDHHLGHLEIIAKK
jgi:hypothetical protein